jgi:hypothetical protein
MPTSQTPPLPDGSRSTAAGSASAVEAADPDHHLWRNGRLWWVAFTVHLPGWQKQRVRLSLGTADLLEARRRRDQVLREYPVANGCQLSLRLDGRKPRTTTPQVSTKSSCRRPHMAA